MLDGGWRIDGRRFVAARSPTARSQREDRDFRRAVDAHRHVDRADPAADEHRRVLAPAQARDAPGNCAPRDGADARAARPGRRACGPTARAARRAPRPPSAGADRARAGAPCRAAPLQHARDVGWRVRVQNRMPTSSSASPRIVESRPRVLQHRECLARSAPPACRGRRRDCRGSAKTPCGARERRQQLRDRPDERAIAPRHVVAAEDDRDPGASAMTSSTARRARHRRGPARCDARR